MIALIVRKVDWVAFVRVLRDVDLRFACLASISTFALIVGLTVRWRLFLLQQGIVVPLRKLLGLTWTGQFFNSILPGSTGGDIFKIIQICRIVPDKKAAASSTVLVDRLSGLLALMTLTGFATVADPTPLQLLPRPAFDLRSLVTLSLIAAVLVGLAGLLLIRLFRGTGLHGRLTRMLSAARDGLMINQRLLVAIILSFCIHLWNFLIVYLLARALHIPLSLFQVILMMSVVLLIVMLPITINGHGLRELVLIAYFQHFGASVTGASVRETAVALSLLAVANDLLWSLGGGLIYLIKFQPSLKEDHRPAPPAHR